MEQKQYRPGDIEITGKGIVQQARSKHNAPLPEWTGRHYWVIVSTYRAIDPARDHFDLDMEALIHVAGPCCLHCAAAWSPTLGARCRGEVPSE